MKKYCKLKNPKERNVNTSNTQSALAGEQKQNKAENRFTDLERSNLMWFV